MLDALAGAHGVSPMGGHGTSEQFVSIMQTNAGYGAWLWRENANNLNTIFALFVLMYGSIGALWLHKYLYEKSGKQMPEAFRIPLICVTWASTSIGMTVLNKTLVTVLRAPAMVSGFQMVMAVIMIGAYIMKDTSILHQVTSKQLMTWMVVPILFSAILCSAAFSYQFISLSLQTVVRNTAPLVVLPIETLVMPAGKRPIVTQASLYAFAMMFAGAITYGRSIDTFSVIGVTAAVINMIIAVCDRITQRRLLTMECSGLPSIVCAIVNNFFGLIPTLGLMYGTHEIAAAEQNDQWQNPRIHVLLVLSGIIGVGICYVGFECQRMISATSFFVLQNATKVIIVLIGVSVFGDPISSNWIVLGLTLSFAGSMVYGKSQMDVKSDQERKSLLHAQQEQPAEPAEQQEGQRV